MRSYIKIYGPPINKAIKALEKIATDLPQVCIMDSAIVHSMPSGYENIRQYFEVDWPSERCDTIISKYGEELGEYDFFFEWFKNPSPEELNDLIERIDDALTPLGCKYSITTK